MVTHIAHDLLPDVYGIAGIARTARQQRPLPGDPNALTGTQTVSDTKFCAAPGQLPKIVSMLTNLVGEVRNKVMQTP